MEERNNPREKHDELERQATGFDRAANYYFSHSTGMEGGVLNSQQAFDYESRHRRALKQLKELKQAGVEEAEKLNEEYDALMERAKAQTDDLDKTLDEIKKFEDEKLNIRYERKVGNPNSDPDFKQREIERAELVAPKGEFRVAEISGIEWRDDSEKPILMGDFSSKEEADLFISRYIFDKNKTGYYISIFDDKGKKISSNTMASGARITKKRERTMWDD